MTPEQISTMKVLTNLLPRVSYKRDYDLDDAGLITDWRVGHAYAEPSAATIQQVKLAAIAAQQAATQERAAIRNLINNLLNPGGDTPAQRLVRLERCVVRLIRDALN